MGDGSEDQFLSLRFIEIMVSELHRRVKPRGGISFVKTKMAAAGPPTVF